MINKLPRFFCVIVAFGLLFAPNARTAPAVEYHIPPPLTQQLSRDGNSLYYAAPPVVYVADTNPSAKRVLIPVRLDLLSLPEFATATFSITYVSSGGTDLWGESCAAFPEQAKNAFNAAAAIWGNILQSSVPITISACWANLGSDTTLGYSGGGPLRKDFAGAPRANTWYGGSLANALAGSDLNPTQFDMHITYNSNFSWYFGTDGNPPSTQYDLMSVVLHEIAHGLNVSGSMAYSGGMGRWGYGSSPAYPNIYDTFMRDGSGNQLIDTGIYGNPSTTLGSALTSDNIWFHGSNAMAANGGQRVKMYAPSTWSGGSSYAHMDYYTFHGTANQLMVYAISQGNVIHDPGPIVKGILKDVGWPAGATSCTYAIFPTSDGFDSLGNTGMVTITTSPGSCSWSAASNASWITITAGSAGTGNGTISYSVSANTTGSNRTGAMTIGGQTFTVTQNGDAGPPSVRFISPNGGETWKTGSTHAITWTSSNLNPASAIYIYYWYNNAWQPIAGPLLSSETSYSWRVPNTPTTSSSIFIGIWVNNAWVLTDQSDQPFTITQTGSITALYFPYVDTNIPWQTEIAIINTSPNQSVTGTLKALSNEGQLIETKVVLLSARGRRQITISDEFTNHITIGYIIYEADSDAIQGYTKFYQEGVYRAAIPAVKEVITSDLYIPHIASNNQWWTEVSLVNTTSAPKQLTIIFNNSQSVPYTLNAKQRKTFTIGSLLNQFPQQDIESAVITNASGIIGLELFGSTLGGNQMDGILLTGNTASTIYYPHVAGDGWWTGIVAYNPWEWACTITVTPYTAQGTPLSPKTLSLSGKGKYIGTVAGLGFPAQTAWFKIDSTRSLTGFELFGTVDGSQLAAYSGGGGTGAKTGVFAKIENIGWTGIAFVNTEDSAAYVTLTAYNDNGTAVATQVLPVSGRAKVVNLAEAIFSQDISSATYIAYSSDRNIVGFQLNGTSDGMMLDGLSALAGIN